MKRVLGGIATLALLSSCASGPSASEFRDRLGVWKERGPASYTWTVEAADQLGVRRTTVEVQDGEPVRAVANGKPVEIDEGTANDTPATVDGLIRLLIMYGPDAESVDVRWDEDLKYPAHVAIDYTDGTDDEVDYRVISFEVD